MWERVLDLHPSPEDTYEQRRKKVLVKLQGTQTSTVSFWGKVVNAYGYGYIEEHNDKYYFNIYTTSTNTEAFHGMEKSNLMGNIPMVRPLLNGRNRHGKIS